MTVKEAREQLGLKVRELARKAGISHTQISRLEAGQVGKPSREVLVAIARGLNRNPLPLLILAGYLDQSETQEALRPLFREGAELPEEWGDWAAFETSRVQQLIREPGASQRDMRKIAADVFQVAESDETLWDDSYELAAARGEDARQLRELMTIWRYVGPELRERWLDYGRQLRAIADLRYHAEMEADQLKADLTNTKEKD